MVVDQGTGERDGGNADLRPAHLPSVPPLSLSPVLAQSDRRSALSGSLHTTSYTDWDSDQRKSCSGPSPRHIHSRPRRGSGRSHKTGLKPRGRLVGSTEGLTLALRQKPSEQQPRGERTGWPRRRRSINA